MRLQTCLVTAVLFSVNLFAYDAPGANFLLISPGAKATGMASAFTALCDDPSLLYYNPGGLGLYDKYSFLLVNNNALPPGLGRFVEEIFIDVIGSAMENDGYNDISAEPDWLPGLHPDMQYTYLASVLPLHNVGKFGISYTYFFVGKTLIIDEYGNIGESEAYRYAIGVSYGMQLFSRPHLRRLGLGASFKFIHSQYTPDWAWGKMPQLGIDYGGTGSAIALDFGMLYRLKNIVGVGVSLQNIGSRLEYKSTGGSDRLPATFRWGITFDPVIFVDSTLFIGGDKLPYPFTSIASIFDIKVAYDQVYDAKGFNAFRHSLGLEFSLFRTFNSYFGVLLGGDDEYILKTGTTLGFGLDLRTLKVDVATDRDIYDFRTENWYVQVTMNPIQAPDKIKNMKTLNTLLTATSAAAFPGGGQFYKGESLKGSLFLLPALFLGHYCFTSDSDSPKTLPIIGLFALYGASAIEALLN